MLQPITPLGRQALVIVTVAAMAFALDACWFERAPSGPLNIQPSKRQATAEMAFTVSRMTECDSSKGFVAGILRRGFDPIDLRDWLDDLERYDAKTSTVVWTYKFFPVQVVKAGSELTVVGERREKEEIIYFFLVPNEMVSDVGVIEFVERK